MGSPAVGSCWVVASSPLGEVYPRAIDDVMQLFSDPVRAWFSATFGAATAPQSAAWPLITSGHHTLVSAPTGTGKTLAAFLASIDRLVTSSNDESVGTRVLYISPLRALAVDVERNLRAPLVGIAHQARRLDRDVALPTVGVRSGDTEPAERRRLQRHPPDILITTPESLYLMLTSSAAQTLSTVDTVIIDEIHSLAPTKRGAHLAISLERLVDVTGVDIQRIGLSATQRPLAETAAFLGGLSTEGQPRPVEIVDLGSARTIDVRVSVPIEDMADPSTSPAAATGDPEARRSIWPSLVDQVLTEILAHRSTIVFCNARRSAERLAARLNAAAADAGVGVDPVTGEVTHDIVRAHHGSIARDQRREIEDRLKQGDLRGIVATSSLELGIDMGAVDRVIQIESPGSVARGLQRIGRAGHSVDRTSAGTIYPKHRGDLLEAAAVARAMVAGDIETISVQRAALDVVAQQIVAMVAVAGDEGIDRSVLCATLRRTACCQSMSDDLIDAVLDLLDGRYPSTEFTGLRPRVVWDRHTDRLTARPGALRLAVTNGGTIPDRGLYGVFLPDGTRVGELDEEMVYESRVGETFGLGATTWRIEEITFERVVVTPAPGVPAKMPFWHGDRPSRPAELGVAVGALAREVAALPPDEARELLMRHHHLDALAATNLIDYLADQRDATGVVPDDRTIVVERFRDEIGDWRLCILTPWGAAVHAPWAMAIGQRAAQEWGVELDAMWADDGIVVRLPDAIDDPGPELWAIDVGDLDELVVDAVPSTAMFAARFRECAARALLLPRRRPDRRTPLWQQRQRAADLLQVASRHPEFPMLLETTREVMRDVFNLDALRELLTKVADRRIRVVEVATDRASPMATSLLFTWVATHMYDGDAPLAERRAAALSLDRGLLGELLGTEDLRDLLDPAVLVAVEEDLQWRSPHRRARGVDAIVDMLAAVGACTIDEIVQRVDAEPDDVRAYVAELLASRRLIDIPWPATSTRPAQMRCAAAVDAARYRDALGCQLPAGLPSVMTQPVPRPLEDLIGRYARTHAPFTVAEVADEFGLDPDRVGVILGVLAAEQQVIDGAFRPGHTGVEWCAVEVMRVIRRRSIAALRAEIDAVPSESFVRFGLDWHGVRPLPDVSPSAEVTEAAVADMLERLNGLPLHASALIDDVVPARAGPAGLATVERWVAEGSVMWIGAGSAGPADGRVRLVIGEHFAVAAAGWEWPEAPSGEVHDAIRSHLGVAGASFWWALRSAAPTVDDDTLLSALWDLVWSGEVTNDAFGVLRAWTARSSRRSSRSTGRRPGPRSLRPRLGSLSRQGPPAGAGRWSLVNRPADGAVSDTEVLHQRAIDVVLRHGVVTREAVLSEAVRGGFAAVYPVLCTLEDRGDVRRGYFVDGLGAAQFAAPEAVDRLREPSEHSSEPVAVSAVDPAQPFGAALPWPHHGGRATRSPSAVVVISGGRAVVWCDRRSRHLIRFDREAPVAEWLGCLTAAMRTGRTSDVEIKRHDGGAAGEFEADFRAELLSAGFVDAYKSMRWRPDRSVRGVQ